ncbi:MAG: cobalamin-binding protein [Anaerolineales bacterium]|nr:cobalamin-binding protein [Anaerolineales bacterium]
MFRKTLLLTLLITLLLAGCAPASTPTKAPASVATEAPVTEAPATEAPVSDAITVTDGLGRSVVLDEPAQRIVSLAPSNTEILFAIGAGDQVIGRDEFSDYPAEAASIESVGGSMGEYSVESIVALKPDLVLAAEINSPELVKQLEDLGLTVYYLTNPTTIEEMYINLEIVGELTGHDVTELVDSLKARVAAVDEKIMILSSRPSVFYEIDATDPAKPYTYGPGTFGDLLITRAGGFNIGGELTDAYPQISLEQIIVSNPTVILLGDAMWGVTVESVVARPGWETIEAVKANQIFPIDDNLISRPGPRLVDGLEQLAKLLHPGAFE